MRQPNLLLTRREIQNKRLYYLIRWKNAFNIDYLSSIKMCPLSLKRKPSVDNGCQILRDIFDFIDMRVDIFSNRK